MITDPLCGYLVCFRTSPDAQWWPQSFFKYGPQAEEYVDWVHERAPKVEVFLWESDWLKSFRKHA